MKFTKMKKLKLLVLTDHSNHSSENSLYTLVQSMRLHPNCGQIDVATRANEINTFFFDRLIPKNIFVTKVTEDFAFSPDSSLFKTNVRRVSVKDYDAVWLRMPPPLSKEFLEFLTREFKEQLIINDPVGIYETGTKAFLTNFTDCCPPLAICSTIKDIEQFKEKYPIVLKPFRDYGGKGKGKPINYLGVKFLKNVGQGDKRIVVVDGQIMGASLRLPAQGSWICNVSQGGSSNKTEVSEEEIEIIKKINPVLSKMGIVMYGVDTLVGDNGKRVLSEINTTSIGGLPQIARMEGKPLVKQATDLLWDYITKKITILDGVEN